MTITRGEASGVDSLAYPGVSQQGPVMRPITGGKLTDTMGAARSGGRKHEGIDIFAPEGTPIHAVAGGTVVQGFTNTLGGNVVRIQGDDGRFYYYAHLTPGSTDHLQVGQRINAGQVIGGVGHSGDAKGTPDHLHLQVRENGQWINPYNFLMPLPEITDVGGAGAGAGAAAAPFATDPFAIDPGAPPSVADADGDGLIDQFEAMFGTDPNAADTDKDSLSDAYETSVSHTNPLSADTDNDGLTDADEIARGTDAGQAAIPASVRAANFGGLNTLDSDRDGLSDGYEGKIGTDALSVDSDRDGLSDGFEAARGSNPLSMDSDRDGLTDGFESSAGTLEPVDPATGAPGGPLGAGPLGSDPLGHSHAPGTPPHDHADGLDLT